MAIATLGRQAGGGAGLARHTIGNALVVYPAGNMTKAARNLAMTVAPDTENDLVVVDLPASSPISMWESVARALPRSRRGVRLVIGARSRETTALAGHWLAERLKRTVLVPDGLVVQGAGGSLFVHSGQGSGWVRCSPGRPPKWEAKRFPRPTWDGAVVPENFPTSARGLAEQLPGGVWIRPIGDNPQVRANRARLIETMPCQPEYLTVVLGSPGGVPLGQDDIALVWRVLPENVRRRVRFVQYGPMSVPRGVLGQVIADAAGQEVVFFAGMPVGPAVAPEIFTVRTDGSPGWHTYARELAYRPRAAADEPVGAPAVLSHRAPFPGGREVSPGVYWLSVDAVVEVVQAGLLVRPPAEAAGLDAIRSIPAVPDAHILMFDAESQDDRSRMEYLAGELAQRLSNSVRHLSQVIGARSLLAETQVKPALPQAASGVADTNPASERYVEAATEKLPVPTGPAPAAAEMTAVIRPVAGPAVQPPAAESPSRREDVRLAAEPVVVAGPGVPDSLAPVELPASPALPPGEPASAAPAPVDAPLPTFAPTPAEVPGEPEPAADTSVPVEPAEEPEAAEEVAEPLPAVARLQPVPTPDATGSLPERGIEDERAWLRRTLNAEFGTMSNSVARILSEHPGFQGALTRSSADVLTDAVAVQLYLTARGKAVDDALRTAEVGPHVPLARCVVSGLSRLPTHRGPAVFTATPTPGQWELYRSHKLVTEWGFLHALTEPPAGSEDTVDVLVWSMTGRRTRLLETEGGVNERVLFVPGSSFKVLELAEPQQDGTRGRILLRELAAAEIDADGRVDQDRISLDELALNSLRRQLEQWAGGGSQVQVAAAAADRFGALPGLA
ncbi:hypothetical protein [Saccharopolyspora elongata]|uniref:Uncharacterized protein n=1 Tax=Saccharopolyspora elongata TaxID=2530387 RepID=A0A4R4Z9V9_9PSEU|nr:hypothetical protein [Saccharopolyspora elongata]TDD55141.1 hypothetical protein E1288_04805 [Saccharopolyspora elongata]